MARLQGFELRNQNERQDGKDHPAGKAVLRTEQLPQAARNKAWNQQSDTREKVEYAKGSRAQMRNCHFGNDSGEDSLSGAEMHPEQNDTEDQNSSVCSKCLDRQLLFPTTFVRPIME